jgi:hypothetical protein
LRVQIYSLSYGVHLSMSAQLSAPCPTLTHPLVRFSVGQVNFFPGNLSTVKLTKFVTVKGDESMLRFEFCVNSKGYVSHEFGMVIAI